MASSRQFTGDRRSGHWPWPHLLLQATNIGALFRQTSKGFSNITLYRCIYILNIEKWSDFFGSNKRSIIMFFYQATILLREKIKNAKSIFQINWNQNRLACFWLDPTTLYSITNIKCERAELIQLQIQKAMTCLKNQ